MSTGILQSLVDQNPLAKVSVAVGPAAATLFRAIPGVEQVIIIEKQPLGMHWVSLWHKCVGTRWDMIVEDKPLTKEELKEKMSESYLSEEHYEE